MDNWMLIAEWPLSWLGTIGYAELPWYWDVLIALWIGAFGANVGSFINVVVYRLPLYKSVVTPRSRCPACGSAAGRRGP